MKPLGMGGYFRTRVFTQRGDRDGERGERMSRG